MRTARLPMPHDALLEAAEAMALAGFDALAADARAAGRRATSNGSAAWGGVDERADGDAGGANGMAAAGDDRDDASSREWGAPGRTFGILVDWLRDADTDLPLRRIDHGFALEPAETALLALLFAAAVSEHVARHVAATTNGGGQGVPVWLAQRLIAGLRTDSLAAAGALRRFGLIDLEGDALRIEARAWLREPVLDRFCGAPAVEPDVAASIAPFDANPSLVRGDFSDELRAALVERGRDRQSPVVIAGGAETAMVAASLASLGLRPSVMHAGVIPEDPARRDHLARMWSRDAALDGGALVVVVDDQGPGRAVAQLGDFVDRVVGHVVVVGERPGVRLQRGIRILGDRPAGPTSRTDRWRSALGPSRAAKVGAGLGQIASQFRLSPSEIDAVCERLAPELDSAPDGAAAAALLWHAAGRITPAVPVAGVTVVEPAYTWSDIVLAPPVEAALRRVEMHVRHATTVLDAWGFGARLAGRGRGVAALFAGPSGTGKTMAAEVLASSLDLRMMVIDLSQIISKYIGETSKNIAAAFDQAERSGAVMIWNEGDAVWGSRGSVGTATDRHLNAEVGDLLQRIEAFEGFTVVTTNLRNAIDPAFLRRFRFVIDFPLPSERERLRLWTQVFPKEAPVASVDWAALAALPLTGGSIRNVALGSAFLAAEGGGVIDARRIAEELAQELQKHDQPMPTLDLETAR